MKADGVDVVAQFEQREGMNSGCPAPSRIQRFLPSLKSLRPERSFIIGSPRSAAWTEREKYYEAPEGFTRKHFLTAVAEVNLATPEDGYLLAPCMCGCRLGG